MHVIVIYFTKPYWSRSTVIVVAYCTTATKQQSVAYVEKLVGYFNVNWIYVVNRIVTQ
jgi:hypothetical protein